MFESLVDQMHETMPVSELRRLLALGKTESYWLIKKEHIETVTVCGKIRVSCKSFDEWYKNQTRYSRIDGIPPGTELKQNSYSVRDAAEMLNVSDDTIYQHIYSHDFETFQAEHITRITRKSFEEWYKQQNRLRLPEDRQNDDALREISYSKSEIAKLLGINRKEVGTIIRRNKLNCIEVADRTRVLMTSFDKWYESQDIYSKVEPKPEPEHKPFYTMEELIECLGIERSYAYRLVKRGIIKSIRQRNGYLIPQEEVMNFKRGDEQDGNN